MADHERQLSLFVFVDAFGWQLLQRHSFLEDLLPVRTPVETILGYSCTCDPTILTGRLPREHGHFSFFAYDPERSPFRPYRALGLLPSSLTRRGRVRRILSRLVQHSLGYTGYFQLYNMPFLYLHLFDYTEKRDLYQPGGINSGAPSVFDHLRSHRLPFYLSDWRRPEEENLASLRAALEEGQVVFAYLYLAGMDGLLHAQGTGSAQVAEKIAWYDRRLREVVQLAQAHYRELQVFLFSDHGMTDVVETCDLQARIETLGLRFGEDYAAVYDSTMARFWFLQPGVRERITGVLEEERHGSVLSDAELQHLGCDFPDRRYGELIFLLEPGVLLCPSFMGESPLKGMHGYHPAHPDSVAMLAASTRPDPMPQRLDDLYTLMMNQTPAG